MESLNIETDNVNIKLHNYYIFIYDLTIHLKYRKNLEKN